MQPSCVALRTGDDQKKYTVTPRGMANIHTHIIGVVYSSYLPRVLHLSAYYYCMVCFYMASHDQCLSVSANPGYAVCNFMHVVVCCILGIAEAFMLKCFPYRVQNMHRRKIDIFAVCVWHEQSVP